MRRPIVLLSLVISLFATSLMATNRHQSYVSFDDGTTVIVQATDGREIDSRTNMPLFVGDQIRSGRAGRTEVRLADENVIAVDRSTSIRFQAIADDYDRDASESVVSMEYGEVIVHRTRLSTAPIRLDTPIATYVGGRNSLYAVESDGRGADMISVYEGSVEVRTEGGTDRVRAGEQAKLDRDGVYGSVSVARDGTSDFERWYLNRASRYDHRSSRYLGDRFAYLDSDFDSYGSWVYVGDYGSYVWRPRVSVGWRPYYYGRWVRGLSGCLVWASDEPWGWMPYHYGRWAYSGAYGWVWLPGDVYSPAWVYWAYGPTYVGWVPAGWYDCFRPYYDWLYRPYSRFGGIDFGVGFYGRVRLHDVDLRGWTFANPGALVSTRVDRAALTLDAVRDRISRDGDTVAVAGGATRFTNEQLRNPADAIRAINRGTAGGGTGKGDSGSSADLTPFFRRDPELPTAVRERVTRNAPTGDAASVRGGVSDTQPRGIDRDGRSSSTVVDRGGEGGVVRRDPPTSVSTPTVQRPGSTSTSEQPTVRPRSGSDDWRNRGTVTERPSVDRGGVTRGDTTRTEPANPSPSDWRSRPVVRRAGDDSSGTVTRPVDPATSGDSWRRPSRGDSPSSVDDTPRRVIDRIGGARVEPRGGDTSRPSSADRPRSVDRPSSSSGSTTRSSGSSSSSSSDRSSHSSSSHESSHESSRDSGGHVKRD